MTRLDSLLGRVTMYRLIDICLAVIVAAALVESLLGVLDYAPIAILAHVAVLLAVSAGANRLAALIVRSPSHPESSTITALLLALILPPSLTWQGLVGAAIAAVAAAASKYLLAWRGRHIFNPALVGALVVGFTGLTVVKWWVGTPTLLPVVVAGGVLVLVRTRRFPLALVYVVVAAAVAVTHYLVLGADPASALGFALLSSPIVFLGAFMLTEPLTLPPRRWQQLAEAVIVAVIAYAPITIAGFSTAKPELALLIGNLLAFLVGQRRGIRLDFIGRRALSRDSWEFEFRPQRPLGFRAGQFMELSLPHGKTDRRGVRRVFSIASPPGSETVKFGIRLPESSSSFKRGLLDLSPGATVEATTVGGDFVLPRDGGRPILLVAGGIGITPFIGHLAHAAAEEGGRDIAVVYAVSSLDDLAYSDELRAAGIPVALVSPASPPGLPPNWTWVGPGRLTGEAVLAAVPDATDRDVYLSGPPAMVSGLRRALRSADCRRIRTDVFIGY